MSSTKRRLKDYSVDDYHVGIDEAKSQFLQLLSKISPDDLDEFKSFAKKEIEMINVKHGNKVEDDKSELLTFIIQGICTDNVLIKYQRA
jgi:hypothetical protein